MLHVFGFIIVVWIQVHWLVQNYEVAEGVSLPRSTLYNHYHLHCNENKLDPVNAASFGKLIRSVFLGLRTRRLGTRQASIFSVSTVKLVMTVIYCV
jgi:regulatory factor X 1/2/3